MLEINDLHKRFGGVEAINGVSLQLQSGQIHALVGPNGCGKTTFLNLISGFYTPDRGQIILKGEPPQRIDRLTPAARARLGVGRIFQEPRSLPEFTVMENVTLSTMRQGSDNILRSGLRSFALNGQNTSVETLLELGSLQTSAHRFARDLSFGQRRVLDCLCLIARQTRIMLLDEPFAGVDPVNLKVLATLISEQAQLAHVAVLLVSHEIPSVVEMADEVALMDAGRIIMRGPPTAILSSDSFSRVYLG